MLKIKIRKITYVGHDEINQIIVFLLIWYRGEMTVIRLLLTFVNGVIPRHRWGVKRVARCRVVRVYILVRIQWANWYVFEHREIFIDYCLVSNYLTLLYTHRHSIFTYRHPTFPGCIYMHRHPIFTHRYLTFTSCVIYIVNLPLQDALYTL